MKLRVAYAKRRYKDKTYVTPLVVTSYRDEKGTARNKTVVSLAQLPEHVVKAVEVALKQGEYPALDEQISLRTVTYRGSVVVGPAFVALSLLKQLGIYDLVVAALPRQQAVAILNILVERVVSAKPLSVMAQQRRFPQEPLGFLLGVEEAPALKTWYTALATLEERREGILQQLFARNHIPSEIYLYDITSSYFEGETCPLAAYGYNGSCVIDFLTGLFHGAFRRFTRSEWSVGWAHDTASVVFVHRALCRTVSGGSGH
jgi:hypothetical protein